MNKFEKKEVIQAILIADNNVDNFRPLSDDDSTALLPLVNVAMLDYALESLNRSGIEEVFVYSSLHLQNVRDYVKRGISSLSSWSVNMSVHVIGGEGCRCFGDAMRDLDAKALIRGNFIVLGADTISNADLRPILEEHKKNVKNDKGAAATLIFKEATTLVRTGNEVMIAVDIQNNRLHHHQRLRIGIKETRFEVPLEVFTANSQVELLHNLLDPQIAIGSPCMLSLFSDNFDFQTRDDFVRGILINEEILDSRIYVSLLPLDQYARKVNNWLAYQIVSQDIMNRWAYPLVPDMGIHCLKQQYVFLKNNIYKNRSAIVTNVALQESVVIQAGSSVDAGTSVNFSVIGSDCKIAENCQLSNAFIMDNVKVGAGCVLNFCVVGAGAVIGKNVVLSEGTVVGAKCVIPDNAKLLKVLVKSTDDDDEDDDVTKLGNKAYIINDQETSVYASDSEDEVIETATAAARTPKMSKLPLKCDDSDYTSTSDEEDGSRDGALTPQPDDTNIFLFEVIDSLTRGFQEKSNTDFLILEINSSRYAYNMSLKEVNFYVVKALFSLKNIKDPANNNILVAVNSVLKQLGPVLSNYIKTEDAMLECLKALEDICEENEFVREKISQVVHYLYDKDYVSEDAILSWYEQLDPEEHASLRQSLKKLVEWLEQSSDDEEDDDDDSE